MTAYSTKLIEAARELLKASGYFVENLWHVADVHFMCDQLGVAPISDDEAMIVFAIANEQFDGETGVSWPKLEKALNIYLQRKALLSSMCESKAADVSAP